jgi:hypothetical protein
MPLLLSNYPLTRPKNHVIIRVLIVTEVIMVEIKSEMELQENQQETKDWDMICPYCGSHNPHNPGGFSDPLYPECEACGFV